MKTDRTVRCAVAGAAVVCLAATAFAAVGDLEYAKGPPVGAGVYLRFARFEKLADGKALGLPGRAVVGDAAAKGLKVSAAVVCTGGGGDLDTLLLDTTGTRKFAGAVRIPLRKERKTASLYLTSIGPGQAVIERDGEKIPVTVGGRYYEMRGEPRLYVALTAAAEGLCAFGKTVRKVRLVDVTGNLSFADGREPGSASRGPADLVQVADADGRFAPVSAGGGTMLGQPVQVGEKWYFVKVEGMKVRSEPLTGPMGRIAGAGGKWQLALNGRKYRIVVSGSGKQAVPVPADTYRVTRCTYLNGSASKGDAVAVTSYSQKTVTVSAGSVATVPMGLPLKATISARVSGRTVRFSVARLDAAGNKVQTVLRADGTQPKAPAIDVVDQTGKVVYTAQLEYG